jgi:diguanylate cyclase (GGDEF)-like protein
MLLAERIRRKIERMEIRMKEERLPITVSLGVASLSGSEDGPALFKRADKALYQAKAAGRNRVCLADAAAALV